MSAALLYYSRRSDNVAATATPTLHTGTINANFPLSRLYDRDPATAAKTTSTGDCRILWDYTTARRVDAVWIPIHNAVAGTILRFEGHTANVWTAPTVSATYTVPAYGGDLPRGVYINITTAAGYTTTGFQFWSLFVPNTGIVTALGEIFISTQLRTTRNLLVGLGRPRDRHVTRHARADGGLFQYDRGTDAFTVDGRVIPTTNTVYDDYLALFEDARGAFYPFPIVLDATASVPEGRLVQWVGGFRQSNKSGRVAAPTTIEELAFTWQMVPRGRAL